MTCYNTNLPEAATPGRQVIDFIVREEEQSAKIAI